MKLITCAICAIVAPIFALTAQEPAPLRQPESIPFDLAAALAGAGGFSAPPQILVGSMPEWASRFIQVPAGASLLGSGFLGTSVVAIITMPPASDSVLLDYKTELMKKGWLNPPPQPNYGGGFRPAPTASATGIPTRVLLCNDQQMLTATAARRRGTSTDLTVRLSPAASGICRPPQMQAMLAQRQMEAATSAGRAAMPVLYNPPGATTSGFGYGDCPAPRMMAASTFTNLRLAMSAESVLDHYAKQMQDSGWKASGASGTMVSRTWTKPDSTGTPMDATISVATAPREPACHEITLQVVPVPVKKP